jgi:hypothetical protein
MLNNSEKLVQQRLVSLSCNHDSNVLTICEPQGEKNQSHTCFESNSKNASSGNRVKPHHYQEWCDSGVHPDIIRLNVKSLESDSAYDAILYGDDLPRRNDGRLTESILRRYAHLEYGGWFCNGINPLSGDDSLWGCFKPDNPYTHTNNDNSKGFGETKPTKQKIIKYEHPPKVPTELFCLKVSDYIAQLIWEKSSGFSHLDGAIIGKCPTGETFWQWVIEHNIPIQITEGAKKAGALLSAGFVAIAFPGINNGYRTPKDKMGKRTGDSYLIPQLEVFCQEKREFIFCFDHDTKPKTIINVNNAINKTGKLLITKGCQVSVISWDYLQKGIDDLIVAEGIDCLNSLYFTRIPLDKFNLKGFTNLVPYLNQRISSRYLSEDLNPPKDAQLIGIKSPKNTGKTTWLVGQIKKILRKHGRVLVITHRIKLAQYLCNVFDIDHIDDIKDSETGGIFGFGLCIDSLHPISKAKFNPFDPQWEGCAVIIDECEQVFRHVLNSDTCKFNRVAILETLQNLLKTVISTGGKVYLSDADLSPISINYVERMIGSSVNRWIVQNDFNPNKGKRKLFVYDDTNPARLFTACQNAIRNGKKVLIHLSAQKDDKQWGTINVESTLRKLFPDKKILRVDAETVADPNHEAYGIMDNLNNTVSLYDIVIASPTIETGVSIEIKHFDSVWCIAQCVQTVEAVCQTIERYRLDVDRHIWIAKSSFIRIGNGTINISSLLRTEHIKADALGACLQADKLTEFDGECPENFQTWAKFACLANDGYKNYRTRVLEKLENEGYELIYVNQEENDLKSELKDIKDDLKSLKTPIEKVIQERINQVEKLKNNQDSLIPKAIFDHMISKEQIRLEETEKRSRLELQKDELEQKKSEIESKLSNTSKEIESVKKAQKIEKDFNYEKHCIAVSNAQNLDDKEYDKLQDKRSKTEDERLQEKKGMITRRYLTEDVTPQMVQLNDNGWYNFLSLHYFLTVGNSYLPIHDLSKLEKLGENSQGKTFKPDVNKSTLSVRIGFLKHLNLEQFFDTEKDFTKESLQEWVNELNQKFSYLGWNVKQALGITINFETESPINIVQKILGLVGLKLKCDRQVRIDGERVRFYRLASLDPDGRAAVFTRWEERDRYCCHTKTYKYDLIDLSVTPTDPKSPVKPIGGASLDLLPMEPAAVSVEAITDLSVTVENTPFPVETITDFSVTPQTDSENDPFAVFKEGDRYGLLNQALGKFVEATVVRVCHGLKGFVRLVTDDGFYGRNIELSMMNWICSQDQIDSMNAIAA